MLIEVIRSFAHSRRLTLIMAVVMLQGLPCQSRVLGDVNVEELLQEMASRRRGFDPRPLNESDVAVLRAVLDELLPDTSFVETTSAEVDALVAQLGADSSRRREEAQRELVKMRAEGGRAVAKAVRSSDDLEIRQQARMILKIWRRADDRPVWQYVKAFRKYAEQIRDDEQLQLIARRARSVLAVGIPKRSRLQMLEYCLVAVARSGQEKLVEEFTPLLKHSDVRVAVLVTRSIGGGRDSRFFPTLLLTALKSKRREVVDAAITSAPNCWDKSKQHVLHQALSAIFEGDDEELKFNACFPLMHDFQDQRAIDYLLEQISSPDKNRSLRAVAWIGDARNWGRPAYPELLEALKPQLESVGKDARRGASAAIATYSGEVVMRRLIEMLSDEERIIAQEAGYNLLNRPPQDRKAVLRILTDAKENHESDAVRKRCESILKELKQRHR